MENKLDNKDVLYRIGHFRLEKNLSARDLSLTLDKGSSFINRIEHEVTGLKVDTLLKILEVFNISPLEFFYPTTSNFSQDMEILDKFSKLSQENKIFVLELIKKLNKE